MQIQGKPSLIRYGGLYGKKVYMGSEVLYASDPNDMSSSTIDVELYDYIYNDANNTGIIDTNYILTTGTTIQIKLQVTDRDGNAFLYNGQEMDTDGEFRVFFAPQAFSGGLYFDWNNSRVNGSFTIPSGDTTATLEIGNYYLKNLDTDTNIDTGSTQSATQGTLHIFYNKSENGHYDREKIYWLKIYESGTLKMNLLPAKYNGVAGFYDKVNNTFLSPTDGTLALGRG